MAVGPSFPLLFFVFLLPTVACPQAGVSVTALPVSCQPAVLLEQLLATLHPTASRQGAPGHGLCVQVSDIVTPTGTAVRPGRRLMESVVRRVQTYRAVMVRAGWLRLMGATWML